MFSAGNVRNQFVGKRRTVFAVFLLISLYVPVLLLWTEIIPFRFRFIVMAFALIGIIYYVRIQKMDWTSLGFRRDTLKKITIVEFRSIFFLSCRSYLPSYQRSH